MRVRINIDFEVSPRVKRALKIALPALVVLGASVAYASVPNTFKDGDALSAQTMNDNFNSLDTRVAKLEALSTKQTQDGGISVNATFCGTSVATTAGDLSGLSVTGTAYTKAKNQCAQTCSSPTAHLCASDELSRSIQLGKKPTATGWYSAARFMFDNGYFDSECVGWTSNNTGDFGPIWSSTTQAPADAACNNLYPVVCCD
jgi:hypothetical protein